MASSKKSFKTTKLRKSRKINKWVVIAGVVLIAVIGVVVVRYSGASGTVWSARSSRVAHFGGQVSTKQNGSVYWVGTKLNDRILLTTPSSGRYCITGSFQSNGARAVIYYTDSKAKYHELGPVSGNKGKPFTACHDLPESAQFTAANYFSSGSSTGVIVVNRFEKK